MSFKLRLKKKLDMSGLSAAALARKAGIPKATVSSWLAGSNPRHPDSMKAVAKALGCSLGELLGDESQVFNQSLSGVYVEKIEASLDGWVKVQLKIRKLGGTE